MKTRLLSTIIFTAVLAAVLAYFAFDINRFLALRFQWLYGTTIIILLFVLLWLLTKLFYHVITKQSLKTFIVSGPLALIIIAVFVNMLYQGCAMRTTADVADFLRTNDVKLRQVVESKNQGATTEEILENLNVRLIKAGSDSYHFELYTFLGYGYRILYTTKLKTRSPQSPGGSPTFKWHRIKENWYYYSYLD